MTVRAIVVTAGVGLLIFAGCNAKQDNTDNSRMGDLGRGSTSSGTAGGGTRSTIETHRAETSDGASTASQGTTGTATVTTKM